MPPERTQAFAPGRVNVIGEHTDYNGGLALAFAIERGVTVTASRRSVAARPDSAFVRGALAELGLGGLVEIRIESDLPQGSGLGSSAALTVALCIAGIALRGDPPLDFVALAQLAQLIEHRYAGTRTGLLDQLASLCGRPGEATLIDFASLRREQVPIESSGRWYVLDSGERHSNAASGYNERRDECARACELLGVAHLSEAHAADAERLPEPLRRRARHVLSENARVRAAAAGRELGALLNASHTSLRDDYEVSTPAVEAARGVFLEKGALGARLVGGGFGGSVLALMPAGGVPPAGAFEVTPALGARLLRGL